MSLILETQFEKGSFVEKVSNKLFSQAGTVGFRSYNKTIALWCGNSSFSYLYYYDINALQFANKSFSINICASLPSPFSIGLNYFLFCRGALSTTQKGIFAMFYNVSNSGYYFIPYLSDGVNRVTANVFQPKKKYMCLHLLVDTDKKTCTTYADSIASSPVSTSGLTQDFNTTALNFTIGGNSVSANPVNYKTMNITKFKIYDHLLKQSEINEDYQQFLRLKSVNKEVKSFYVPLKVETEKGLTAHYDFSSYNGGILLNSAPNSASNDYNPSKYNSTAVNSNTNKVKDAVDFNGHHYISPVSGFLISNLYTKLSTVNSFSLCFVLKYEYNYSFIENLFFTSCLTLATNEILVEFSNNTLLVDLYNLGNSYRKSFNANNAFYGNKIDIIVTWNPTLLDLNLYVNGIEATGIGGVTSWAIATSSTSIGCSTSKHRGFGGKIHDCKIYDRALSEQEIKDYHNSWVSKPVITEDFSNYPVNTTRPKGWIKKSGTFSVIELPKNTQSINIFINGGGLNTTDFVDSNSDGLADYFTKTNGTASIVTENGFIGNAQRLYAPITVNTILYGPTPTFIAGCKYKINFKYRSNNGIGLYIYDGLIGVLNEVIPANTGNALLSSDYYFYPTVNNDLGTYRFYVRSAEGDAQAGDWIEVDEINVSRVDYEDKKVLRCTTAGVIALPSNTAYGTWEFDWYKGGGGNFLGVKIISDTLSAIGIAGTQSYEIYLDAAEQFGLDRTASTLFRTLASYLNINTWYSTRITRNISGVFTVWIKGGIFTDWTLVNPTGGSGTNPVTNNTYTSSKYFLLDIDAGDSISNIKIYPGIIV